MIAFHHLRKDYGEFTAVRDLDLVVGNGEVFGFLGPNGAGKTKTIRMIMGILVPTGGRVTIDGLDCQQDRVEVKRRVGYLPDNPSFYDYLRGREILVFVGEMHGQTRDDARARADKLLHDLALDDAAEDYAVNYSAGMKKKLGLACALIHDPPVLVLDEPPTGSIRGPPATCSYACGSLPRKARPFFCQPICSTWQSACAVASASLIAANWSQPARSRNCRKRSCPAVRWRRCSSK